MHVLTINMSGFDTDITRKSLDFRSVQQYVYYFQDCIVGSS